MTRRRALLMLVAAAAGAAACGETPTHCASGWCGTVALFSADAGVLLPPVAQTDVDTWIIDLVFSKLADLGPSLNTVGDSGFVPQLARRWTWETPTRIRFDLDPKAHWHDGPPVTAGDVAFTFQVYRDSLVNSSARTLLEHIASVTAADSHTVVVQFRRSYPEAFFDAVYHMRILPAHLLDTVPRARLASHPFGRHPVGSGAYRFVRWVAGESVELQADSTYFRGRPGLRRVIFRVVTDMNTAVTQLAAGELDAGSILGPPDLIQRLHSARDLRTIPYAASSYAYVGFNLRDPAHPSQPHPLFGDRELRRAIAMAVDREAVVAATLGELGEVPSGPLVSWLWIWSDQLHPLPYDSAAAARSLDTHGWRRGADGVRAKNGRRLAFDLLVPTTSAARRRSAVVIQDQLKRAGVAMQIVELDFNAMLARAGAGTFDAAFLSFNPDPSPRSIQENWSSRAPGGQNYQRYANASFDRLVEQAIAEANRARAASLWHQALDILNDDAPAIWIYIPRPILAVHHRLRNVTIRPDQWAALLWQWRVDPDSLIARDVVVAP